MAAAVALASFTAACSGGDDSVSDASVTLPESTDEETTTTERTTSPVTEPAATEPADTASADTSVATTTTAAAETTTAATEAPTTTAAPETTTTLPPVPVYPLTGVPVDDPAVAARVALVVKIGNEPAARPQTGFNNADIVFEEIVNDNLTRFALVFQSNGSDPVGPIRSGRIQDVDLFGSFNRPLFSWSGGNGTVTRAIDSSDLINIGPNHARVYFRSNQRKAPSNLYSNTSELWNFAPFGAPPPPQHFQYRAAGEAPRGVPSGGVSIKLDAIRAEWFWNPVTQLYERNQNGNPHLDAGTNSQVTTNNVVVMEMQYARGISGSPDAQSVSWNVVHVFTGGNYIKGTWIREDRTHPWNLVEEDGVTPIELSPGRTFIELPREGDGNVVAFDV